VNILHDSFFPSYVWYVDLERNDKKLIKSIKKIHKSEKNDKNTGINSYQSSKILHLNEEFKDLCDDIMFVVKNVLKEYFQIHQGSYINNMWVNINPTHSYNANHTHTHSFLSGVYYVQTGKKSGDLRFRDSEKKSILQNAEQYQRLYSTEICYRPKEKRVILFPAWLTHSVDINNGKKDRISISFDIGFDT
jgi:uncharacterized protein (TIGR02466 family)